MADDRVPTADEGSALRRPRWRWLAWLAAALQGRRRRGGEPDARAAELLQLAAAHPWELDADLRLTSFGRREPKPADPAWRLQRGTRPWEASGMFFDEAQRQAHIADLLAHRPFDDLRVRRPDASGQLRHRSVSGRPRFAADGRFLGYWGIERDVSAEVEARDASAAGEARYRELFERSPSPLVLHRRGIVLDANPAAAALFGFPDAPAMRGYDLLGLPDDDAARAHLEARRDAAERLPVGSSLPVADAQMRSRDGRLLTVQASAVRIAVADGAATLSIFVDISARVAAEAALRDSRNVLATLVSGSPDGMALTLVDSGAYVIVNESCARMLGYAIDEMVGRSSVELGIWHDAAQRVHFIESLLADGSVREMPATFVTKSGGRLTATVSASLLMMDGRRYLVANIRDVSASERLRLEHAAVFRSAIVGIALTSGRDGPRFQLANPRFHEIFGWPADTLVGQPGAVVWPDAQSFADTGAMATPQLAQGKPFRTECQMRRADGSRFWCRLQGQAIDPGDPQGGGTVWIAEDVTERRQLDDTLAAARDAAEAASRAKSAFLANTSHEIRTPLNGLLGLARLAAHDELAPERRQQYLAQLVDSAQNLADIISDILDLSKIEAGKLSVEALPFGLRQALGTLHRSYLPLAEACGLELALELDDAVPDTVRGDPLRVRQILGNFITNALKFTTAGGVRIGARPAGGGRLRLWVADTGPGIDAETRARLFTPFTQGDVSTTRRHGGTGLGLSICRELAALMGGSVGVDSTPGQGSVFWAELPLPRTQAPGGAAAVDAVPAADALAGLRVLVVEDNPVNMLIVTAMLEQWGATSAEATDGEQALTAVADAVRAGAPFDAVLMDVQMPRMGGHEATRQLRQQFDARRLPIIALTAAALVSEREEALAAGMNEFLTKPIDATRLLEALRRCTTGVTSAN